MSAPTPLEVAQEVRKVFHYSASQLEKFDRCNLRWWWEYVAKFKPPQSQSGAVGESIHDELEVWCDTGLEPPNPRARDALRHFKQKGVERGEALIAEERFDRALHIADRVMTGKIDVKHLHRDLLRAWDYKSCADLKKREMTDYQLASDKQLNIYAHEIFHAFPTAQFVTVGHIYIQTRAAIKSELVEVEISRDENERNWKHYLTLVDDMEHVRTLKNAQDVDHNELACNDYGGCPHRTRCNALIFNDFSMPPAPIHDSAVALAGMVEDALVKLNPPDTTRRPEGAPPATPATISFDDLPAVLQKAAKRDGLAPTTETKIGAKKMEFDPFAALAGLPTTVAVEAPPKSPQEALAAKVAAQPRVEIAVSTPPPIDPAAMIAALEAQVASMRASMPATRALLDAVAQDPPAEKKKRGRPPGKKDAADAALAAADAVLLDDPDDLKQKAKLDAIDAAKVQEPPPVPVQVIAQAPAPVITPKEIPQLLFLLIDCTPQHGFPEAVTLLGKWLEPAFAAIKRDTGVAWDFHKFNEAAAMLNKYAQHLPLPRTLAVRTRTREGGYLLEYLIQKAEVIIAGVA